MATLDVRLKKVNKIYKEGDVVAGVIVVTSNGDLQHQGITLTVDGAVTLQLSAKSVGLFEAFYNSLKPIHLINYSLEISKPGKLPSGKTEIPFEVPLKPKPNKTLYETYHGVFINVQYSIKVDMKRSLLSKDLQKTIEFIVENKTTNKDEKNKSKAIPFTISPETLTNIKEGNSLLTVGLPLISLKLANIRFPVDIMSTPRLNVTHAKIKIRRCGIIANERTLYLNQLNDTVAKGNVPKFKIKGKLTSSVLNIIEPLTGELMVESCDAQIKSIEIQLVRVETCGCAEGYAKDATEIQNIQIADGDVSRGLLIPIYMIFPRLFTCPTLSTNNFKIDFEINVVVVFRDDHLVTENFPIKLVRY